MNTNTNRTTIKAGIFAAWALLILLLANFAQAQQQVEFNYNGRVKVRGDAFNGTGQFKFALVDRNSHTSYWSNDATSVAGSEPTAYLELNCIDGFFSVAIGDTETGMEPLIPTVFNEDERIYLRVWFNDGDSGFERLTPHRRVVNPALLGIQSFDEEITLYVDATYGNDSNNGLTTDTAKQTIQAAWNVIPSMVNDDVTIYVLDGIYYESVSLKNKTVIGDAYIRLIGNINQPDNVIITGADSGATTTPIRSTGFNINQERNLSITGFRFEYFINFGITAYDRSDISVSYCNFELMKYSIALNYFCKANISHVTIHNNDSRYGDAGNSFGIRSCFNSNAITRECTVSDTGSGYFAGYMSTMQITGCVADNCRIGYRSWINCLVIFGETIYSEASNCYQGVNPRANSTVQNADEYVTYPGTTTPIIASEDSVVF